MSTPVADRIFGTLFDPAERLAYHTEQIRGVRHARRVHPWRPRPGQRLQLTATTSGPQLFVRVQAWVTFAATTINVELAPTTITWDAALGDYVRTWHAEFDLPTHETLVRYWVGAQTAAGAWVYADNQASDRAQATPFAVWVSQAGPPAWATQAVVYHVFVDRFHPGAGRAWLTPGSLAGFYGGTLRGVHDQLGYIQDLGCNTVWLSPVFASPSHHGYDATDYLTVEPRLGTNADLHALIEAAHRRGMRLMLDFVANHWSHEHPTFQHARAHAHSPYRDWYVWRHWPDDYATYFDVRTLPQLNLRPDSGARQHLLDCAAHWLSAGVDGLRLDYAYGPPDDFWAEFYATCRQANPQCWLFGEIIHHASKLRDYTGLMDGVLDFLLAQALRQTFATRQWSLPQFEAFLSAHEAFFPDDLTRPAFLDNHDMNRILFMAGGDVARVQMGALALFGLGGQPIIYNGTEVGVTQERPIHQGERGVFEEARQPMRWGVDQNTALHRYFTRLIAARHALPALQTGKRNLWQVDDHTHLFTRGTSAQTVLVALNISDQPQTRTVPALPFARDWLNDLPVPNRANAWQLTLPPHTGAILA